MTKSALGNDPLSQGIFSKTETAKAKSDEPLKESIINKKDSSKKKKEKRFLKEDAYKERVNLRLSADLNDWLNDLLKKGRRTHGRKIRKEIWVQAAIELFQAMPIDWAKVESEDQLRDALKSLESRINNIEA